MTVSPNTASRSRALNRCAQSSRSTAFENTHPAVCSADLASSRNTASISTPQTSQTLSLEVPARVPHKKDDQDSTQPHRVESIKSLGDFSFSSSSTCDAILHRHRMSLQRNIAAGYDFFNGLLGFLPQVLRIGTIAAKLRIVGVCRHGAGKSPRDLIEWGVPNSSNVPACNRHSNNQLCHHNNHGPQRQIATQQVSPWYGYCYLPPGLGLSGLEEGHSVVAEDPRRRR